MKSILNDLPFGGLPQFPIWAHARFTSSAMRASRGELIQPEKLTKHEASTLTVTPQVPPVATDSPSVATISRHAVSSLAWTVPA